MANPVGRPRITSPETRQAQLQRGRYAYMLRQKRAHFEKVLASIRFTEKAQRT